MVKRESSSNFNEFLFTSKVPNVFYLCFFMMLYKLFGAHSMQVTQLRPHHDRHLTQGLFDNTFRDTID